MPELRLQFKPTVDVEQSPSLNRGGWSASSLIRFRQGLVEALLGWTAICTQVLQGVARAIHYWTDLSTVSRFAIGTNLKLYLLPAADLPTAPLIDITPTSFVPGNVSSGTMPYSLLIWSLDNFGEFLIANPSQQGIFVWMPSTGASPAAPITTTIPGADPPAKSQGIIVLDQAQIILSWGCTAIGGGPSDPMLLRWCDQSDYTDWLASTTNQAGSYRLPHGSRIISALRMQGMAVLWTDVGLWAVQYIGFPLVFSFNNIGQQCGLLAQKGAASLGQILYWMSDHGFFVMAGGGPQQLPCPIWDIVYKNLDISNADKCLIGTNYHYSEVWWFYPSKNGDTGEIDSYVEVNIESSSWDFGPATPGVPNQFSRTAWTDSNQPGSPVSVDLSNLLQESDRGFTADGEPFVGQTIRSGYADIMDGKMMMLVDRFMPDFLWDGDNPSIELTLLFRSYPGDTPTISGPYMITPTSEYITLRKPVTMMIDGQEITAFPAPRGREVAVQVTTVAGWWRWGNNRIRAAPAGTLP